MAATATKLRGFPTLALALLRFGAADLCIVENGGRGEDPPPDGDLIRLGTTTGKKEAVATSLQDPVWVAVKGGVAFVGLFHAGQIVRVDLADGDVVSVATGLSCPEGMGHDGADLYVVENPVGNECQQIHRKAVAQLTRINLTSGLQTFVAPLSEPHGMDVQGGNAYICECGEHQLTRVDLASGHKERIAPLASPSGCAVGGGNAYAIEQGDPGKLIKISLHSGEKETLISDLHGAMGVAVDASAGLVYVSERAANRVRRVSVDGGESDVLVDGLRSNIGLAMCPPMPASAIMIFA